jgi:hypothetical protein
MGMVVVNASPHMRRRWRMMVLQRMLRVRIRDLILIVLRAGPVHVAASSIAVIVFIVVVIFVVFISR